MKVHATPHLGLVKRASVASDTNGVVTIFLFSLIVKGFLLLSYNHLLSLYSLTPPSLLLIKHQLQQKYKVPNFADLELGTQDFSGPPLQSQIVKITYIN